MESIKEAPRTQMISAGFFSMFHSLCQLYLTLFFLQAFPWGCEHGPWKPHTHNLAVKVDDKG